ncbi:hypothetical protein PVK06_035720 [Gossypium arboreum]|uniref:Uncharacterized protein n=1 Tax=Gossypium arboreum TaxID=29729 RepID=A0ABR0NI33_GOSAR|nr:hypothetical protein PVK06_035720 [Gossypium arboreum]
MISLNVFIWPVPLKTVAYILNRVSTKAAAKTPYENVEFGGRNMVRDIDFKEELDSNSVFAITFDDAHVLIPIIDQEVNPKSQQENVEQLPIQDEVIVPEEQT